MKNHLIPIAALAVTISTTPLSGVMGAEQTLLIAQATQGEQRQAQEPSEDAAEGETPEDRKNAAKVRREAGKKRREAAAAKRAERKKAAALRRAQNKAKRNAAAKKRRERRQSQRVNVEATKKTERSQTKNGPQPVPAGSQSGRTDYAIPPALGQTAKRKNRPSGDGQDDNARKQAEDQRLKNQRVRNRKNDQDQTPATQDEVNEAKSATADGTDPTKRAAAVVKKDLTDKQRRSLRAAERQRRIDKRKRRRELLGAAAAGAVVGAVINELGGRVIDDQGDRLVVEREGRYFVRKDENELFRRRGVQVRDSQLPNGNLRTVVRRPNGVRIITVRDPGGRIIRRTRHNRGGEVITLIDTRNVVQFANRDYRRKLGKLRHDIPRDSYIVEARRADRGALKQALRAEPVERVERVYSLNEVRNSERLRQKMRRIDLDTLTFATGEFSLTQSQVVRLDDVAASIRDLIDRNPREIFLIEGHTDAVGGEVSNLTLSDRRADTVAQVLTDIFELPPENFVVQGYGESYLKIDTLGSEERNRRVTIRRITPLIQTASR